MKVFYDFHIHSALSPCADDDMTPNNIVNMAKLKGLDVIAITDHNSVKNAPAAMAAGESANLTVLAGMEIETAEEVHLVALFSTLESAKAAEDIIWKSLPPIQNRKDIFGNQIIMDENDDILKEVDRLLVTACSLSIDEVFNMVKGLGGIVFPAHVDRSSYSILSNLGFIPKNLNVSFVEVSKNISDINGYISGVSCLKDMKALRNSDAHTLGDISERENYIEIPCCDIGKIFDFFRQNTI